MATTCDSSPIGFFQEILNSEDSSPADRAACVRKIRLISCAAGPKKTRDELLPIIETAIKAYPDEDEFLYATAEQLGGMVGDFADSGSKHASPDTQLAPILPLLRILAAADETIVRDEAVKNIGKLVEAIPDDQKSTFVFERVVPILEELAKTPTMMFTSRVSATKLFPLVHRHVDPGNASVRKLFVDLCHDETPLVRRSAATVLTEVFSQATAADITANFMTEAADHLWNDDTHEVSNKAVLEALAECAAKFSREAVVEHITPRFLAAADHRSWRLRMTVAQLLHKLFSGIADENQRKLYLPSVVNLMVDNELEVSAAAGRNFEKFAGLLTADELNTFIIPNLDRIYREGAPVIAAPLAVAAGLMAPIVGAKVTQASIVPFLLTLKNDDTSVTKLSVAKTADSICNVVGPLRAAKILLPALFALVDDKNWRVRCAVVEQLPHFAVTKELWNRDLQRVFLTVLMDNVWAVRDTAMGVAQKITEGFGAEWMADQFLPKILENGTGSVDGFLAFQSKVGTTTITDKRGKPVSYLTRITVLQTLVRLASASVVTQSLVEAVLLPLILAATRDHVANVRLASIKAAKLLATQHRVNPKAIADQIKPSVTALTTDTDLEVRHYAKTVLEAVSAA